MSLAVLRRLLSLVLHPLPAAVTAIGLSVLLFDAFPADSLMYPCHFRLGSCIFLDFPIYRTTLKDGIKVFHRYGVFCLVLVWPGTIQDCLSCLICSH